MPWTLGTKNSGSQKVSVKKQLGPHPGLAKSRAVEDLMQKSAAVEALRLRAPAMASLPRRPPPTLDVAALRRQPSLRKLSTAR